MSSGSEVEAPDRGILRARGAVAFAWPLPAASLALGEFGQPWSGLGRPTAEVGNAILKVMSGSENLTRAMQALISEAFHGRPAGGNTWFLDDEGLLDTARTTSSSLASRSATPESATLAGHVEHVRWFVALAGAFARGERPQLDWAESWGVREVDPAGWRELLAALEQEVGELQGHLEGAVDLEDPGRLLGLLGLLAHVAYHVGAVRQLKLALSGGDPQ
ncbi:MAG: hypothetical protein OXC09_10075 [Truepera sp.]|nr:hypothetical protein [Truepera sp.]